MNTDSNSNSSAINYATAALDQFRRILLPHASKSDAETLVRRQEVELMGAAKMAALDDDVAGAALLMAIAEILTLAVETNSVKPLANLQTHIQFLNDYRATNEPDSIIF